MVEKVKCGLFILYSELIRRTTTSIITVELACTIFLSQCLIVPLSGDNTPGRRQSKTSILPRNVDQKSIETEFSIAICSHWRQNGNQKHCFYRFLSAFVDS